MEQNLYHSLQEERNSGWRRLYLWGPRDDKESIEEIEMARFKISGEEKPYPTVHIKDGLLKEMKGRENQVNGVDVLICVTLYNENMLDLRRTLKGISDNLKNFDNPEKVTVVFVFDGIQKVHESIYEFLSKNKVLELDYFKKIIKETQEKDSKIPQKAAYTYCNYLHRKLLDPQLKETEKQSILTDIEKFNRDLKWYTKNKKYLLKTILCIKVKNAGKLSSHHWFFSGFCPYINPKYCFLVDCGTLPLEGSLTRMYRALETDGKIGGVCGYMGVLKYDIKQNRQDKDSKKYQQKSDKKQDDGNDPVYPPRGCCQKMIYYLDYIVAYLIKVLPFKITIGLINGISYIIRCFINAENAQLFEYTIGHIIDKGFESFFGFISVLPGAFSAYRWSAINDSKLLEEYLQLVLDPHKAESTCELANKYLAEDRIMCLSIFTRRRNNFTLKYLPDAQAVTDVPATIIDLIKQRRRWNNGSWFATLYVIQNAGKINESDHSCLRKTAFRFQIFVQVLQVGITYVLIGLYYTIMQLTVSSQANQWQLKYYQQIYPNKYPVDPEANPLDELDVSLLYKNEEILLSDILVSIFLVLLMIQIFLSLLYKMNNKSAVKWFQITTSLLGIYVLLSYYFMYSNLYQYYLKEQNNINIAKFQIPELILLVVVTVFAHMLPCIWYPKKSFVNLVWGLPSYIFYSPTFIITMILYSFCNFDDVSWGNREDGADQAARRRAKEESFKNYKMKQFSIWAFVNLLVIYIFYVIGQTEGSPTLIIKTLAYFTAVYSSIRGILSFLYHLRYYTFDYICMCCNWMFGKCRQNNKNVKTTKMNEEQAKIEIEQDL